MGLIQTKPLGVMIGGPRGPRGLPGPTGPGVPSGGLAGQMLVKATDGDQDTVWADGVLSVAGKTGHVTLDKNDVGLANVDNTSDANKPVSGPQAAALALKANLDSPTFTGTVGGITKAMVGLGNVDNTSDMQKPVSLAQQAALDLKAPIANPTFTGTVGGITKAMVGLGNVDNTADMDKPVSTAQQAALDLRAPKHNPVFTGTVSGITKAMVGLGNVDNTADADKPVSNPVAAALATKANVNNPTFTGVVSGVTKAHVGLGNVDNTADMDKPVSTPQQAALALKANLDSPTFTGTVGGITKSMVGLDRVDNTSDMEKPVSTAQAAAIAQRAPLHSPQFTGTVGGITKAMVGLGNVDNTSDLAKPISTATQAQFDAMADVIAGKADAATVAATYAPKNNPTFTGTVSGVTKAHVGLGNVDNTADLAKPVSLAQQQALDAKAPINNPVFTGTVGGITKAMVGLGNVDNTSDLDKPISTATQAALNLRAPINNPTFTGTVGGITKAMVGLGNVDNTSDLNKPISTAVQAALDGKISGHNPQFTFDEFAGPTGLTKAHVGLGNVDNTADMAKPVSTAQQAALALKANVDSPTFTGTVGGITKAMVGLGNVDNTSDANKPVSTATQAALDTKAPINNPTFTGTVQGITKAMVGLGNVDNTSDALKPISNATQAALDAKAPINNPTFTGTVAGITKAMVGLGNVDNTSDANKPVSTAQAAALALKANINNPTFTGTVGGITKAMVGLGNVDNTPDNQKPVSQAQQAALDLKANIHNPVFTGTVGGITKAMVGLGNVDNTSDANKPLSTAAVSALAGKVSVTEKGQPGGVATLGVDGKVPAAQLPEALAGGLLYAGTWDADTNTPDLSAMAPPKGTYYKVSVAGTTLLDGNNYWGVGDLAIYNGDDWDRVAGGASEVTAVNGRTGNVVLSKSDVGLANVDNTSDLAKPISTAVQAALDAKAPINNPTFTGTVSGIDKTMIGLPNVDNTSDLAKPISTAVQVALDAKAPINSPAFTGTVTGITKAMVGLGNVDNTSDMDKPISTAVQAALDQKVGVNELGEIELSKAAVGLGNVDNTSDLAKPISTATQAALDGKVSKAGDSMTGALNYARGTVASAASPDIWSGPNQINLTGNATVTGFPAAPQPGAERVLILGGTAKFQASDSLIIDGLANGQTYYGTIYDTVTVRAISTTQFRLTVNRYDGRAMVGSSTGGTGGGGEVTLQGAETLHNKTLANPALLHQELVDGNSINWNMSLGSFAMVTLEGDNRAFNQPTFMKRGVYFLYITQGTGGGKRITNWHACFKWTAGTPPVLSTQAGKTDLLMFISDGTNMYGEMFVKGAGEVDTPSQTLPWGTNLSGPEWSRPGLRRNTSTQPNLHFTFPRAAEVAWLAQHGFKKNRLCIQWELLQPIRKSSIANQTIRSAYGVVENGGFYNVYAQYITAILDAHAAIGAKCILDLHNYCRYVDFVYETNGSVVGFQDPTDPLIQPYTTDPTKVREVVMSTAANSLLPISDFVDFWQRAATLWKDHPGLGGYGLMNEPHDMPAPGGNTPWNDPFVQGNVQDYTIWPQFAQAAINAIRAIDPNTPIYVSGNEWDSAMAIADYNPGFPLVGQNLIYEVHMYLDASSSGHRFDYDYEVSLGYSAGEPGKAIDSQTGFNRIMMAINWAASRNVKLALTELGMPLHRKDGKLDDRWVSMYKGVLQACYANDVEVYSWMGGAHWPIHGYPINHVPQWHQHKTLEPHVGGVLKEELGFVKYQIFDDGGNTAPNGGTVTVTVYVRGNVSAPFSVTVASDNGGNFDKTTLTIPAGSNGWDSFTFTPGADRVTTLTYSRSDGGPVPPQRTIYTFADPVTHAATDNIAAARQIMAAKKIGMWNAYDAYTDYADGQPCAVGQEVRAVADSGFLSEWDNPMNMLNSFNHGPNSGFMTPTLVGEADGRRYFNLVDWTNRVGWCKKRRPHQNGANSEPVPLNRMPFKLNDPHFMLAVISIGTQGGNSGIIMQCSEAESSIYSQLELLNGVPRLVIRDGAGTVRTLEAAAALTTNDLHVISAYVAPGDQKLRVDSVQVDSDGGTFSADSWFNQILLAGGWSNYVPQGPFTGRFYLGMCGGPATGLLATEAAVLEDYALDVAGKAAGAVAPAPGPAPVPPPPPPAPTPAPPAGGTDSDVNAIMTSGIIGAWWDPSMDTTRWPNPEGTSGGNVMNYDQTLGRLDDRGPHGYNFVWPQFDEEPQYQFGGGYEWLQIWVPDDLANLGGSTLGFCFIGAIQIGPGYYNTICSDVNGGFNANNGYRLRYDGDVGGIQFSVGTGSQRVTVTAPCNTGTRLLVTAFHDLATNTISLQINNGQTYTANAGAPAAGSTTMWMWCNPGRDVPGPADYFYGFFYGGVITRNTALNSSQRAHIRLWAASKAGINLNTGEAPAPAPAPAPGTPAPPPPAPTPAPEPPPAPPPTGYPFGSRLDYTNGIYPFGIRPTVATNAQMDSTIINCYRAWRNNNVIRQSGVSSYWASGTNPPFDGTRDVAFVKFGENWQNTKATVSEGMGYGMLIMVVMAGYSGDGSGTGADAGWPSCKQMFDELFTLVRMRPAYGWINEQSKPEGRYLMDWELWPNLTSKGGGWNAMDGDLDIALALLMAHRQWGSSGTINYFQEALNTINAIRNTTMKSDGTTLGLGNNHTSRTSDYMIGHFRSFAWALQQVQNTAQASYWGQTVIDRCWHWVEYIRNNFSPVGLQPDFIANTGGEMNGQSYAYGGGVFGAHAIPSPGGYGDRNQWENLYFANAQRNPWRFGTDYVISGDTRWRDACDRLSTFFKNDTGSDPKMAATGYNMAGQVAGPMGRPWPSASWSPKGLIGPLTNAAMVHANHQSWLNALWSYNANNFSTLYYDSELQLIPMIVAAGNWWTPEARNRTSASSPTPPPPPPAGDGMPTAIVGVYWVGWESWMNIKSVTQDANVVYLFNARPDANGNFYWEWPNWPSAADVQAVRQRGQKVILTLGGAGFTFPFNNRTHSTNCVNSVKTLIAQFGGVDGVDFNTFEGSTATDPNELIWIAQQFKAEYGSQFAITAPPAPNSISGAGNDLSLMVALHNAGVLTYCAPQFYDWVGFNDPGFISNRILNDWIPALGASKVVVGLSANYPNGPSLSDCTREWDLIEQAQPGARGVFAWNAQLNHSGGNVWTSTMKARVIGSFNSPAADSIAMWGDSITNGVAGEVQALYAGRTVYNGGVSGQTSTQIRERMVADTAKHGWVTTIWAGHNDYQKSGSLSNVQQMVAALQAAFNAKYVVLSNLPWANSQYIGGPERAAFEQFNADLASTYPNNYLDIFAYLQTQGDGSANDNADIANGLVPRSLRFDDIHLNQLGDDKVAARIKQFLDSKGW